MVAAIQTRSKVAGSSRLVSVDCSGVLDSGESITGTVTAVDASGDITTSNVAANTSALTINGQTVAAGKAVQFLASGGTAGRTYTIVVTFSTDSTPAQASIEVHLTLKVT